MRSGHDLDHAEDLPAEAGFLVRHHDHVSGLELEPSVIDDPDGKTVRRSLPVLGHEIGGSLPAVATDSCLLAPGAPAEIADVESLAEAFRDTGYVHVHLCASSQFWP